MSAVLSFASTLNLSLGNMLGKHELPEILLAPSLDVMRTLSSSERDLIRIIVETIQELRNSFDTDDDNDEVDDTQVSR